MESKCFITNTHILITIICRAIARFEGCAFRHGTFYVIVLCQNADCPHLNFEESVVIKGKVIKQYVG